LTRVTLRIPDDAVGGTDIPLTFKPFHRREPGELESPYPVNFAPYYADWPCHPDRKPADFPWTYDVHYTNTVVRVLGKDEPPPPPDYGIRIALGEAEGKPGDTVEVPIMASTEVPLYTLRLAFESDPTALRVDAVEVNDVISPVKGPRTEEVARGQMDGFLDCTEDQDGDGYPDACFEAAPFAVQFYKSEERFTVIDVSAHLDNWITLEPREVARLKVRIQENAPGTQTDLLPAKVPLEIFHQPVIYESGGFKSPLNESNRFGPATEIHGSHVLYPEAALKPFVRGDGNVDGRVDLSDAISTLNYLFLGAAVPGCVRAADVNDDGTLGLSDAVYLLVSLFQGGRLIPPPYPNCGPDTTADSLNCVETTCRRV